MSAFAIDAHIYCLVALVVLLLHSEIFGNDARTSYNVSWDLYSLCLCAYLSYIESNTPIAKAQTETDRGQQWATMSASRMEKKKNWTNKNKYAEQ